MYNFDFGEAFDLAYTAHSSLLQASQRIELRISLEREPQALDDASRYGQQQAVFPLTHRAVAHPELTYL